MQNCYNSGERIPREKRHDVDDRLTNKHIQTLQFVQEVVNENKVLKQRVEELEANAVHCDELHKIAEESKEKIRTLQEQYLKRADEINAMMAEKHRGEMMQVVQEKLDQEKKYSEDIIQLKAEIKQLELNNKELLERIQDLSGSHEKLELLNAEISNHKRIITDLQMEVDALKSENQQLSGEKTSQFSQIQSLQSLKTQNENLAQDLKEMAHKNMALSSKVTKLEQELKEMSNTPDQLELIENLKNKLSKLHKERSVAVEKEGYYQKQIGDLKYEIEVLREQLKGAEVTKERVLEEYYKLTAELNYLRKNQKVESENKNFKDFVKLKRELAHIKDENQQLKEMSKGVLISGSKTNLPMLRFEPAEAPETTKSLGSGKTKAKGKK